MTKKIGKVYLVSAGPGDRELLTLKAYRLLKQVDVIAYDALISDEILEMLTGNGEMIAVGYRGYQEKAHMSGMHPAVIQKALCGQSVARLKQGDAMIFGRAYREIEDLLAHKIPFEIIPGVTSGIAVGAEALLPLTYRDLASDLFIMSGHKIAASSWEVAGRTKGTVVIYMGARKLGYNCQKLIEYGKCPNTPAAYITNVSLPNSAVIVGTLMDLPHKVPVSYRKIPAIIVVGEIVKYRQQYLQRMRGLNEGCRYTADSGCGDRQWSWQNDRSSWPDGSVKNSRGESTHI